uniref:Nucleoprotein TPR n=1 Tax=Timema monikensis TaxID=170555 RepID=A0A7R9EEM5_9NEOP|nr:unnamed protein product [Timema monikensis]
MCVLLQVEMLSSENSALRGEAGRLRQRVNFLVERSNKASPEDWRRLQQEREMLTKQLATEKELLKKSQDDLKVVRQDKARLEEQCKQQTEEVKRLSEELEQAQQRATRLQQELDSVKSQLLKKNSELATITEDLGAKEALLADIRNKEMQIRKIAKKYKLQYEEKKKAEEIASQSPLSTEVSPEAQEQFRNEGRREVEQRIKENEDRSTDTIKELTDQVSSTQVENESLRKENAIMKTAAMEREERSKQAKDLLKNAREKILQITEQKNNLARQLAEMQGRGDESPQLKAHYEARIARLVKENAEIRAEKQQEKDRLMREMELMAQRSNQLQRLLEKTQGSKPSTSTGADKGSVDPPTANIKPMAGSTSSGPKQLQAQQAVAPWSGRGETPFASIRPMSQSRTVAVLQPTTQQASSNGSCAVLVPPLQQCVHTTGPSEALSSSPTSSHTDYMPATSSAGPTVRQVVVLQPTQQIPSAESTQDMEAESISEAQAPPAQSPQGPQQQVVALVLPQQTSQSQAASSSTTVTTSQAGSKRPRDIEAGSEQPKLGPQVKRTRTVASGSQEMFQTVTSEGGVEVEYQVPTSSQRDQEDDIIVLDSEEEEGLADEGAIEEPDDGPEFEGEADNGESYGIEGYDRDEQELADYDEGEGPDIDEDQAAQDSNEVDVVDDSSEVPNQSQAASESNVGQSGQAAGSCVDPPSQQHSEATSSGPEGGSVGTSQPLRGRTVPPLTRQQQQQLLLCKLAFCKTIADECQPFLQRFQTSKPMTPYLFEAVEKLLRYLMNRCVKPDLMKCTGPKLLSIDTKKSENLILSKNIDIGFATKRLLGETAITVTERQKLEFIHECRSMLTTMIAKLQEKSPLKQKAVRGLSSLDPCVIQHSPQLAQKRFSFLLEELNHANIINDVLAENAKKEYLHFCNLKKSELQEIFRPCDQFSDEVGLDTIYGSFLIGEANYKHLWEVIKICLVLSHGNATVEGGFSVNKSLLVENMHEKTVIAQRHIHDEIQEAGGIKNIHISKKMLDYVRGARKRYHEYLEMKKQEKSEKDKKKAEKRKLDIQVKDLEGERKKLMMATEEKREAIDVELQELKKKQASLY